MEFILPGDLQDTYRNVKSCEVPSERIMNYDINRISSEYAKKGREELYAIKAFFEKNGIAVLETTPTQIRFVPWKADSAVLKKEMYGILTWNPINQMIIIEYHCHFPYQGSTDQYSLILKWYLLKWNERYGNRFHKTAIKFIYPGQENSELILQASCKAARHTLDKRIKVLLLRLHDILDTEKATIAAILEGNCPQNLKYSISDEISGILTELNMFDKEENRK